MEELLERKGSIYTFLNPVSYLNAHKEKDLFQAFDGIFADGSLLVKAIRLLYGRKVTRRSFDMTSLAPVLLRYALQEGKRVAIIASKQEEVEQVMAEMEGLGFELTNLGGGSYGDMRGWHGGWLSSRRVPKLVLLHQ